MASPAVVVERACKGYGRKDGNDYKPVLDSLDMTVERGIIYGLLGASGCGKTTLLSCIVGRRKLDSGNVWVLGGRPGEKGSGVPGPRVGYMPQDIALVAEFSVRDALYYFGRIYGMTPDQLDDRFKFLCDLLELPNPNRLIKQLSGGQQRRVSLAAALVHEPELLILDEPTVGLDPMLREKIWGYMTEIAKKGTTVIITTHYIDETKQAHKIGLLRDGQLLAQDSPTEILRRFDCETLEEAFLKMAMHQNETSRTNRRRSTLTSASPDVIPESNLANDNRFQSSEDFTVVTGSRDMLTSESHKDLRSKQKGRYKAVFIKSLQQFTRHPGGLFFSTLFPIIQVVAFFIAVGHDPKELHLAIVNDEAATVPNGIELCQHNNLGRVMIKEDGTCDLYMLSCWFLEEMEKRNLLVTYYNSTDEAKVAVVNRNTYGALYFPANFSSSLGLRIADGKVDDDIVEESTISVWLDMTDYQISNFLKGQIHKTYEHFTKRAMVACGNNEDLVQYKGPASDAGMLGEMIFGAVAMNYKSVSLKIHIMEEPKRLMCTKMFFVPTRRISRRERKTDVNANVTSEMRSCSKPLNVPMREEGVSLSFSIDRGDSGFYSDHSYSTIGSNIDFYSMLDSWDGNINTESSFTSSPSKYSSSSCGSWQRRSFQSMSTKFDLTSTSLRVPTTGTVSSSDSQMYSNSVSGTCESIASSSSVASRRTKLGLALLITVAETADMDVIRRCVEHSNQLQSLVCRLRLATLRAAAPGKFVATLHKATEDAAVWLSDLMFGSRLQPVWLSLVTSERRQANKIAENLLADLCSVISVGDTKNTNFFISTLLTQVLTHHLGWVTTVSPYDCIDPTNLPEKENSRRNYNALWAQLGDLCGSIGYPPRIAKTIVSGTTNRQFINRLLNILTYFMRCGDVKRNDFTFQDCVQSESKVTCVKKPESSIMPCLELCSVNNSKGSGSVCDTTHIVSSANRSTLNGDVGLKKSTTVANLDRKLSNSEFNVDASSCRADTRGGPMRRNPSIMISSLRENSSPDTSDSSQKSSVADPSEAEKKVLFVLGDDEKLVGLKNKSSGGKSVKKSSKVHNEPINLEATVTEKEKYKEECSESCDRDQPNGNSSVKCCSQTLEHSKPIKHSGFKFEFDKYPQIVTNYMKSKNLEILDRHYIGKPGNLKLDNFQFDPTVVPQIQEERCETCYKCQMMESLLQTPTNASEMEYLNDFPRQVEPQYAKETMVDLSNKHRELSPKTFVRKRKENTVIVDARMNAKETKELEEIRKKNIVDVKEVIEFPLPRINLKPVLQVRSGFDASLLGGVTDHYVPDLILQGTLASPKLWEGDLRRDLDLTLYLNKTQDAPAQAVAIIGDTDKWEVRVVGGGAAGGGLSPLVGGLLDALPAMRRARVPAHQCLLYVESKLREFCVLSKTLADMLMSTDFCNITTLTKSLNIDVNDVPLLLAVASTHTPQVAARYGISYR